MFFHELNTVCFIQGASEATAQEKALLVHQLAEQHLIACPQGIQRKQRAYSQATTDFHELNTVCSVQGASEATAQEKALLVHQLSVTEQQLTECAQGKQ